MKQKVLSILALLLMAVTGAWAQTDMKKTPLTLEAKTAGTIVVENPPAGMQYSKNNGAKTKLTEDTGYDSGDEEWTITVESGEKVQFFGNGTSITSYGRNYVGITDGTADCYIYGNIMSLVDEDGFATANTLAYMAFYALFFGNTHLFNHPAELVLPATTLAVDCYSMMFAGCTNLTTAPELPATTLANYCYSSMFNGCTSLTTAPVLPATTLAEGCYYGMFAECTNLKSVTCLATDISAREALDSWLYDVAADGTFTKAGMTSWTTGASGIPSGWTKNNIVALTDNSSVGAQLKCPGESCTLTYKRAFTADKPSTVCLPFAYAPKTGEQFYTFTGITLENNEYVATMTEYTGETLAANTPYLYKAATTGNTDFSGTYTIPDLIEAGETKSGDWTFKGIYQEFTWVSAPTGTYGFSGVTEGGISQGQFVKVGENVYIKPMRCYLEYKGGAEDYAGAPQLGRRAGIELPQSIRVRLVNANGEVTSIGEEISVKREDAAAAGWYLLDGRKLSGTPTQKGIYIVNGKKVVIK